MGSWISKLGFGSNNQQQKCEDTAPQKKVYSWDLRNNDDVSKLVFSNKTNQVLFKAPGDVDGNPFTIQDLTGCKVFLLDHLATVNLDNCKDCAIFIGPTKQSVFLRNCRDCTFIISCQQFRMRDCYKVRVLLHCTSQPIIEASTEIKFASFQFYYNQLADHISQAMLSPYTNFWYNVYDFSPNSDSAANPNFTILNPLKIEQCLSMFDTTKYEMPLPDSFDVKSLGLNLSDQEVVVPKTYEPNSIYLKENFNPEKSCLLIFIPFENRSEKIQQLIKQVLHTSKSIVGNSSSSEVEIKLTQTLQSSEMSPDELERAMHVVPSEHSMETGDVIKDSNIKQASSFKTKMKSKGTVVALLYSGCNDHCYKVLSEAVNSIAPLEQFCSISKGHYAHLQFDNFKHLLQMQFS